MKYLKTFDTETNYVAYRDDKSKYLKPNVSFCDDKGKVHYNYPKWDTADKPFIDLGLPSGTLWATCNVGASTPTDNGFYFQWGDTVGYTADQVGTESGKKKFNLNDYKWYGGNAYTKYTANSETLALEDDAANANMGGDWHMPTEEQCQELISYTTTTWMESNGVSGEIFTSKNNRKAIFIPAAGYAGNGLVRNSGINSYVWSSMLSANKVSIAQYLSIDSLSASLSNFIRYTGFSIRGVLG